jgi:hypothetical protein
MPALSAVVLTDAASPTPVDHSFAPRSGVDAKGVATLVRSTGVPIGDERLTISRSRTATGREKAVFKLTLPIVQNGTVDGITRPTVVRVAYATIELSFDGASSTQERKNCRAMISDLLGDGQAIAGAVIDDLEALY